MISVIDSGSQYQSKGAPMTDFILTPSDWGWIICAWCLALAFVLYQWVNKEREK